MKSIIVFLIYFSPLFHFAQSPNCAKFKNGKFIYPNIPNVLSERKGSVQKSYTDGVLQAIWKVVWIDECTIQLKCKKVFGNKLNFKKGDVIYSQIVSTEGDCMTIRVYLIQDGQSKTLGKDGLMCLEK